MPNVGFISLRVNGQSRRIVYLCETNTNGRNFGSLHEIVDCRIYTMLWWQSLQGQLQLRHVSIHAFSSNSVEGELPKCGSIAFGALDMSFSPGSKEKAIFPRILPPPCPSATDIVDCYQRHAVRYCVYRLHSSRLGICTQHTTSQTRPPGAFRSYCSIISRSKSVCLFAKRFPGRP